MGIRRFVLLSLALLAAMCSCAHKRIVLKSPDGASAEYESTADTSIEGLEFVRLADGSTTLRVTKSDQAASTVNRDAIAIAIEILRHVPWAVAAPTATPAAAAPAAAPAQVAAPERRKGIGPDPEPAPEAEAPK